MNNLKKITSKMTPKNKTGGVVTNTVMGVGALIVGTIVILVITQTLSNANLISDATLDASVTDMRLNFSQGLDNIGNKIPTILLIVAVVFLFGALVLLMRNARQMGVGGGGSL